MAKLPTHERLAITLSLTIGGTEHKIAGGDVKSISLDLRTWGFEGHVEFFVQENKAQGGKEKDALLADFLKPDLIEVSFSLAGVLTDATGTPALKSIQLKGYVVDKTLAELTADDDKPETPILMRRYGIRFVDAAQLLWKQHHPCELYTSKTIKDVIDAHKGDKITVAYDWSAVLEASHPMIFVGLPPSRGSSFYDFVLWVVRENAGVFIYDYVAGGYKLAAVKDDSAAAIKVREFDVDQVEIEFPEVIRHDAAVLNGYSDGPKNEAVVNKQSVTGIRRDHLIISPIADDVSNRVTLEKSKLTPRGHEFHASWLRFPADPFLPNALIEWKTSGRFQTAGLPMDTAPLRVKQMRILAEALSDGADYDHLSDSSEYRFELHTRLEPQAETHVDLPDYVAPQYPLYVEGTIVSEVGDTKDETWQTATDGQTSLDKYKVKIPLWANQIITVPFNPNLLPGHFYFPAYKDERVLVALDFLSAWLKRFLDWRAGARLPSDGQGVHLLVGKTTKSGTSMKHDYQDGKPEWQLKRTNDKDNSTILITEGNLLILVKEDK